jgi:hypothetical protein
MWDSLRMSCSHSLGDYSQISTAKIAKSMLAKPALVIRDAARWIRTVERWKAVNEALHLRRRGRGEAENDALTLHRRGRWEAVNAALDLHRCGREFAAAPHSAGSAA